MAVTWYPASARIAGHAIVPETTSSTLSPSLHEPIKRIPVFDRPFVELTGLAFLVRVDGTEPAVESKVPGRKDGLAQVGALHLCD